MSGIKLEQVQAIAEAAERGDLHPALHPILEEHGVLPAADNEPGATFINKHLARANTIAYEVAGQQGAGITEVNDAVTLVAEVSAKDSNPDAEDVIVDALVLAEKEAAGTPDNPINSIVTHGVISNEKLTSAVADVAASGATGDAETIALMIDDAERNNSAPRDIETLFTADKSRETIIQDTVALLEDMQLNVYKNGGRLDDELHTTYREYLNSNTVPWDLTTDEAEKILNAAWGVEAQQYDMGRTGTSAVPTVGILLDTAIRPHKAYELYHTQIDDEPSTLRRYLDVDNFRVNDVQKVNLLSKMYYAEGGIMQAVDQNVSKLRERIHPADFAIAALPDTSEEIPWNWGAADFERHNTQSLAIFHNALVEMGMSNAMAMRYIEASQSRLHVSPSEQNDPRFDTNRLRKAIDTISYNIEEVGAETINTLHKKFGVLNLDRYDKTDIANLTSLLRNDPSAIQRFTQGNTRIIFADTGDWNGALNNILEQYRQPGENDYTILFDVSHQNDFYRRLVFLKQHGIKPSSIVVAAHGNPGKTHFGLGEDQFELTTPEAATYATPNQFDLSQASLKRIADEFMQPSQGENPRKAIILNSCSSDVAPPTPNNNSLSTAEVIARQMQDETVDVYGASDVAYVEGSARQEGVKFTDKENNNIVRKISVETNPKSVRQHNTRALIDWVSGRTRRPNFQKMITKRVSNVTIT